MTFADFMYYYYTCDDRMIPMNGFSKKDWKRLCYRYLYGYNVAEYFPDEPVPFRMTCFKVNQITQWIFNELRPYMTLKHIAEKAIGRYVCEGELQAVLATFGFPPSDHYPISEKFFQAHNF